MPCSLKAGEGPTHFALASQEPTALSGKNTEGTQGRNVYPHGKVGWSLANPSRVQHQTTKAQKWKSGKTQTGIRDCFGLRRSRDPMENDGLQASRWIPGKGCCSGSEVPAKQLLLARYRDNLMVSHDQRDAPMPSQPLALQNQ